MTHVHGKGRRARVARRGFLGALAVAPAALACATSGSLPRAQPTVTRAESEGSPAREKLALEALRSLALERDAGPAIVFRAGPARPGGKR